MGETIGLARKKPVNNLICGIDEPIIIPTPKRSASANHPVIDITQRQ